MAVSLVKGGKKYYGKTLKDIDAQIKAEQVAAENKKERTKISENTSGNMKIEVYSPARNEEGLTATDVVVRKNKAIKDQLRQGTKVDLVYDEKLYKGKVEELDNKPVVIAVRPKPVLEGYSSREKLIQATINKKRGVTTVKDTIQEKARQTAIRTIPGVVQEPLNKNIAINFEEQKAVQPKIEQKQEYDIGFQERRAGVRQREERVDMFKNYFYEKTGLEKKPEETKIQFFVPKYKGVPYAVIPSPYSISGFAKSAAQFPIEAGTSLTKLIFGSPELLELQLRASNPQWFDDSSLAKQEIKQIKGNILKGIVKSYDPTTTAGLFNIAQTAITFGYTADKLKNIKAEQTVFTVEESATKRVMSAADDLTQDITYTDVKALLGKKEIAVSGTSESIYRLIDDNTYGLTTKGYLVNLANKKKMWFNIEGKAIRSLDDAGFDMVSITESNIGKSKPVYYFDYTQTAEIFETKYGVGFKSLTRSAEIETTTQLADDLTLKPGIRLTEVTPEAYAMDLAEKGKISFTTEAMENSIYGKYYFNVDNKIPINEIAINEKFYDEEYLTKLQWKKYNKGIAKEDFFSAVEDLKQETISHELIHYKTNLVPKAEIVLENKFNFKIPYEKRPSEIIAFGLEDKAKWYMDKPYSEINYEPITIQVYKSAKPSSISTGYTYTPVIRDIFVDENVFTKLVKSEEGSIVAKETFLFTDRAGIDAETFAKNFENIKPDYSLMAMERKAFDNIYETASGSTITTQTGNLNLVSESLPSSALTLQNLAKQEVLSTVKLIKAEQTASTVASASTLLIPKLDAKTSQKQNIEQTKVYARAKSKPIQSYNFEQEAKPMLNLKSLTEAKPLSQFKPMLSNKPMFDSKAIIETKPMFESKPMFETKAIVETKALQTSKYVVKPMFNLTFKPEVPPPPPPPPIVLPSLKLKFPSYKSKKYKPSRQQKRYTPSATSLIFDIKGNEDLNKLLTGYELRPIPLFKTRKKTKRVKI